ncbi:FAD-binding oxidoreductase [Candidatus Contendibacter odensensis]|uniref:FAD/FMN-containing dehydrogenase n=1 Tax=Candidatus Contendobacter odensis Run_B_J11 TaxID=1400861 RepID=A0A7U7GFJ4_9GAMM|nr:FAD-binding oxidoreductase [Candidatus Contendobacter odensis]CDH47174.1 putative FAD/FMN-containing dehydrogenase [Candidatus Contendobacter odensis Run_B_J11]
MHTPNESAALLDGIRVFIEPAHVRSDPDSCLNYGRDWTRLYTPNPLAVVLPGTVEQVQQLVRYANEHRLALVPSGGRTGLSGAAVACRGELVVSLERMSRILDFDPTDRSVTCQAGVVTEAVQNFARDHGLYYPVDFASRGSSQIGGNIATNAGGIKVIRYGLTRDWVTGLKVVTGCGDLLDLNRGLIKNASGYDLRHLFIGSEGTLGIIVEATLKLTRPLREPSVMVLGVPDLDSVMSLYHILRNKLELSAFEFFSERALRHVLKKGLHRPFDTETPYYVLVEFENPEQLHTDTALALFEHCAEQGWLADGVISQSESQVKELWRLREDISESIAEYQPYKNDVSVRISRVPDFLAEADTLLTQEYPDFEVLWYGHIGDGNLHINILKPVGMNPTAFAQKCGAVSEHLFAILQRHGGSISAEHGVGLTKKPYLHYTRDETEVNYLRAIKQVFDPNRIMNPGKIFD